MTTLHVVFRVGEVDYVVAARDVLQMESYTGATPVPGSPSHVAGLVQVRGRLVPVVDLRALFRLPTKEHGLDSRVVVIQHGDRTVGLLTDSAREVVGLEADQLEAPPHALAEGGEGFVRAVARQGKRMFMVLDHLRVMGEEPADVR